MGKKNHDFGDFTDQVKKLKKDLQQNQQGKQQVDSKSLEILQIVKPVIKAFVDADSLLEIQSSPPKINGFHIVYAHTLTFRITVTCQEHSISIESLSSQGGTMTHSILYSGGLDESAMIESVKNALMSWYKLSC